MRARSIRIVGAREIRSMLGDISRQRAWQITNREDFPEPMAQLTEGRFWTSRTSRTGVTNTEVAWTT
jgi:prophage regulatory protein